MRTRMKWTRGSLLLRSGLWRCSIAWSRRRRPFRSSCVYAAMRVCLRATFRRPHTRRAAPCVASSPRGTRRGRRIRGLEHFLLAHLPFCFCLAPSTRFPMGFLSFRAVANVARPFMTGPAAPRRRASAPARVQIGAEPLGAPAAQAPVAPEEARAAPAARPAPPRAALPRGS